MLVNYAATLNRTACHRGRHGRRARRRP